MARPLLAWPRPVHEAVAAALAPAWERWCGEHALHARPLACVEASAAAPHWQALRPAALRPGAALLGVAATGDAGQAAVLARRLFGADGASRLGVRVAARAILALADELAAALSVARSDALADAPSPAPLDASRDASRVDPRAPSSDPWRPWSGSLLCPLSFAPDPSSERAAPESDWAVLLDAPLVRALAAARSAARTAPRPVAATPPHPAWAALGAVPLRLEIRLGGVELGLGALQSLRPGDVLQLPQALDEPLDVHLAASAGDASAPLCRAVLGRRGAQRAVALVPSPLADRKDLR